MNAENSVGQACPRNYVPAETVDRAIMEFLKKLELKPELVHNFVLQANEIVSDTGGQLKEDLKRVQERLVTVRSKLNNLAEAVAEPGKSARSAVGKKMEALEVERTELEQSESRRKKEIEAGASHVISAQERIRTLGLFRSSPAREEMSSTRGTVMKGGGCQSRPMNVTSPGGCAESLFRLNFHRPIEERREKNPA